MSLLDLLFVNTVAWKWISISGLVFIYLFAIFIIIRTLLQNRNPSTTLSWVLILVLLPYLGLLFYFFFGQRMSKRWIFRRLKIRELVKISKVSDSQLKALRNVDDITEPQVLRNLKLIRLLLRENSSFLSVNNSIDIYHNGTDVYSQLFKDLSLAEHFIHIQYYLFEEGSVANRIQTILLDRLKSGVEVNLMVDGIGSRSLSSEYIETLRAAGAEVFVFRPVRFPSLTSKINYRNHRKIVVIDGAIGYTGGINIADKYIYGDGDLGFWRDTHIRIFGDAVKMLEAVFLVDRYFVTNKFDKSPAKFFPSVNFKGDKYVQIANSGPESSTQNILNAYFMAISSAQKSICITTPYFVPNESLLIALKTAAAGGVDVQIILPGRIDSKIVQYSSRSYIYELLRANIKVYFYEAGFIHAKIMLVDSHLSIVGSANFDYRSFYHNFEISALIYNIEDNKKLRTQFEKDKKNSMRIKLVKWKKRPASDKLKESVSRLLSPLI
ncbi:MAG: cardiolipin synthase [Bacteroidales bacterium]|nr:cardiolipin synthase [Bacteroidales bacterium]